MNLINVACVCGTIKKKKKRKKEKKKKKNSNYDIYCSIYKLKRINIGLIW